VQAALTSRYQTLSAADIHEGAFEARGLAVSAMSHLHVVQQKLSPNVPDEHLGVDPLESDPAS
jgi:hypothetical protein